MASWSPTLEGFRAVFLRPSVPFAEVLWRWSFAAAALVLIGFGFIEYLDTLPVSNADLLLLRSGQPFLVSRAVASIFGGSGLRFVLAAMMIVAGLTALWISMAAIGRGFTLDAIVRCLSERSRHARDGQIGPDNSLVNGLIPPNWRVRSLAGLHFLRAGLAMAGGGACVAALILAGSVSSNQNPQPDLVFVLALIFLFVVWLMWTFVSGFLSLASVFVVHAGEDTFGALSATLEFCHERRGPVAAVSVSYGLAHLVLFFVATSIVAFPLGFAGLLPVGFVLSAVVILTLLYFALVDTLYVARLAGYVAILEAPPAIAMPAIPEPVASAGVLAAPATEMHAASQNSMVDQDELILSDTPADDVSIQHSAPSIQSSADRVDPDELILSDHSERDDPDSSREN
jgi:hypothetical protein